MMMTYNELTVVALAFILWSAWIYIAGIKKGSIVTAEAIKVKLEELQAVMIKEALLVKVKELEDERSD